MQFSSEVMHYIIQKDVKSGCLDRKKWLFRPFINRVFA